MRALPAPAPVSAPVSRRAHRPGPSIDLARLPLLGALLRWRHARLVLQVPLLLVAALVLFDGFTGPQRTSANFATTLVWVYYRGLLLLALLVVGNLFCMGCPFTGVRALARRLLRPTHRWPRALRNKWLPIAGMLLILWAYEALHLSSSPLLTAWLVLAYFVGALVIDGVFEKASFCRYVCPLGLFNWMYATVSPAKISTADPAVCRTCAGKWCVNGRPPALAGCEHGLFVPMMATSMDCTLCLNCLHACPNDNVALVLRAPAVRLIPRIDDGPAARGGGDAAPVRWPFPARLDLAVLFIVGLGASLVSPLATTGPGSAWIDALTGATVHSRPAVVAFAFAVAMIAVPLLLGWGVAAWSRRWSRARESVQTVFTRTAPAYVPLALGTWGAHAAAQFLSRALTVVPLAQRLASSLAPAGLPAPHGRWGPLLPTPVLYPIEAALVAAGLVAALVVAYRQARAASPDPDNALRAFAPQALALTLLAAAALWILRAA